MAYTVHLRLCDGLLGVARVLRVLRRHAVIGPQVGFERDADPQFANVHGSLHNSERHARALATALGRTPNVVHAAILDDTRVVVEFFR